MQKRERENVLWSAQHPSVLGSSRRRSRRRTTATNPKPQTEEGDDEPYLRGWSCSSGNHTPPEPRGLWQRSISIDEPPAVVVVEAAVVMGVEGREVVVAVFQGEPAEAEGLVVAVVEVGEEGTVAVVAVAVALGCNHGGKRGDRSVSCCRISFHSWSKSTWSSGCGRQQPPPSPCSV
jgi:hypothetical protein